MASIDFNKYGCGYAANGNTGCSASLGCQTDDYTAIAAMIPVGTEPWFGLCTTVSAQGAGLAWRLGGLVCRAAGSSAVLTRVPFLLCPTLVGIQCINDNLFGCRLDGEDVQCCSPENSCQLPPGTTEADTLGFGSCLPR